MAAGIDLTQLKRCVIEPSLKDLGLGGEVAVNLLTGTALAESRAAYLKQIGGGPALGLWQMEPATHDDCWNNYLRYSGARHYAVILEGMLAPDQPRCQQMVSNLRYACAIARIRYYRAKEALPAVSDASALSRYHKVWYNTCLGAADYKANIALFQAAINA
ncbi:hypothetical protein D5366_00850 [Neokomagataea tanensis]|uniref:Lytic transglycosylase domain-containing protein n=1 Tax=Neokomagataea tanensis TaxID=661191 RepID=A0A4Y6V6C9_9PROT|nr:MULTISPECIES: hypothetical protein [Neokomagataea]QDH24047.1 hypothetical protein D5366_00850 [Neokomagataea tanensis]